MGQPSSFKPLQRVTKPEGGIWLERPDGTDFRVTEVATDENDGLTDDDFDFDKGKEWANAHND